MVTVTKYLTQTDLKRKICDCKEEEKLKVLFKEVSESELRIKPEEGMTGAYILREEKIIASCNHCKKVYFLMTTFEGSIKEQYVSIDSVELFDGSMRELRQVINNIFDEYENDIVTVVTDDHAIKVLDKHDDEEKIVTRYVYLNREDEDLYKDLMED
ncbi:hypothetical protein [Terrisporobacter mayombei]|uniref:Uncharacterized protein n=1 Tax=Terrisporobacter mayombei TaxID=1541 RepID=A0ABY9Q2K1_9FIRM|nr:hypothetical protein [Terrisporobacter mayombei]MCC3869360.1 hypothetical protein [Terrisporobacter mayombei]WMT82190.1 hypothetical protein TEMA_25480 [Terrisporobacter mayombei]